MKNILLNRIFLTAYVCSILYGADLNAEEIAGENRDDTGHSLTLESSSHEIKEYLKDKGKVLFVSGLRKNRIMAWSGFHNYLYGYEDQRYLNGDSGDYIKTDSQYYGIELVFADFSDMQNIFRDARLGLNICVLRHGDISSRVLYAVPGHDIPQETIAGNIYDYDTNEKWWTNAGIFVGLDKKWYAVDFGLTLKATVIDEKEREKLDPGSDPSDPVYTRGKGRGLMFDESGVSPNFFFRFGPEEKPNFTLSVMREDYDPLYGIAVVKVRFPLTGFFMINFGGYLHQTEAVFLEPVVNIGQFSIGARAGLIVNYNDDNFEKAGISDSAFYAFSLAFKW
jgi:hypothetical protein